MQILTLYKYQREGGGVTVSPIKPDCEYTELFRIIADEGKILTKDFQNLTLCADVETPDGWYELDAPVEKEEI